MSVNFQPDESQTELASERKRLWVLISVAAFFTLLVIGLVARGLMRTRLQTHPGDERFFAKVVEVQGDVRRQAAGNFSFETIEVGDSVQVGDSLVTDAGAGAVLELATGEKIRVNEGVLLHLEFTAEKDVLGVSRVPDLEVIQGTVEAIPAPAPSGGTTTGQPPSAAPAPRIHSGGEVVEIRKEKVLIRSATDKEKEKERPGNTASPAPQEMPPILGLPSPLSTGPVPTAIPVPASTPTQKPIPAPTSTRSAKPPVLSREIDNTPPTQVELLSPTPDQALSTGPIVFKWKTTPPRRRSEFVLERSDERQGVRQRTSAQKVDSDLNGDASLTQTIDRAGFYTFALRAADDSILKGLKARVDFEVQSPTEKIKAAASIEVGATPAQRTLILTWRAPLHFHACVLEIWDKPDTTIAAKFKKQNAEQGQVRVDVGTWRTPRAFVQITCGAAGKKDIVYGPMGIVLFPRTPEVILSRAPSGEVTLSWKLLPFADRYEVQEFTTQTIESVTGTEFHPKVIPGGRWRVRSWYGIEPGLWSAPTAP